MSRAGWVAAGVVIGAALSGAAVFAWRSGTSGTGGTDVADAVGRAPAAAAGAETNVVVVIGCTVRADQTSLHGGPPQATPFLAKQAASGTRFDAAIAAAPWTQPAVTAILTSRYAMTLGMIAIEGGRDSKMLPASVTTLAERMKASGRDTFGWSANPNASEVFGFDQGFDRYETPTQLWREGMTKVDGGKLVDAALAALAARPDPRRPFYLQLLLVDAHAPDTGAGRRNQHLFEQPQLPARVARYRGMLRDLDAHVRALWKGLGELGHDERNTLFVFVADHGEGLLLPAHHGRGHGNYLYPSTTHIPWVMRGPGVREGKVVRGVVSQVDVMPTVLGVLGLPPEPGGAGRDWSATVAGEATRVAREPAVADTWFRGVSRAAIYTDDRFCQKDFRPAWTKVVEARAVVAGNDELAAFRDGCFDWTVDRAAERPVADPALTEQLVAWRAEREREAAAFAAGAATPPADPDADVVRALEGLGYVGD